MNEVDEEDVSTAKITKTKSINNGLVKTKYSGIGNIRRKITNDLRNSSL